MMRRIRLYEGVAEVVRVVTARASAVIEPELTKMTVVVQTDPSCRLDDSVKVGVRVRLDGSDYRARMIYTHVSA